MIKIKTVDPSSITYNLIRIYHIDKLKRTAMQYDLFLQNNKISRRSYSGRCVNPTNTLKKYSLFLFLRFLREDNVKTN